MSFLQVNPGIEQWLKAHARTWRSLHDSEYKSVVERWKSKFSRLIELRHQSRTGTRAMAELAGFLPADVFLFSGVRVPAVANLGGPGTYGYHATALREVDRDLANTEELILVDTDMSFSCVFSHEAGAMVWEHLYVARGAV